MKRLVWLDVSKGLAICWVVYFHFFRTVFERYQLPSPDWSGVASGVLSILRLAWWKISGIGFHAVGVFIILSGWTLMYSMLRRVESHPGGMNWWKWYGSRLMRLYPMYWVAHLVYLASPFVARLEPIDDRIVLSLLGLRFINIEMNFMYLNAAWWYFSMLIQLYLLFPLLFMAAKRLGPLLFLLVACGIGLFTRYLLLVVWPQNGLWALGGFAVCRLPEFAIGIALALWHSQAPERVEWFLLRGVGFFVGLALYPGALWLYDGLERYVFVDLATGACCFLEVVGVAGLIARCGAPSKLLALIGAYSYGLYLIHQPYVIWLGLRIRPLSVLPFLGVSLVVIAILSAWGIVLERSTNALINRLVRRPQIRT